MWNKKKMYSDHVECEKMAVLSSDWYYWHTWIDYPIVYHTQTITYIRRNWENYIYIGIITNEISVFI